MRARSIGTPRAGTRRRRGPSVAVRETADGAHRPSNSPAAVRYTSVDTATRRSTARRGDTQRDKEETARQPREFAAGGPFPQVVAGVGFEPT